MKVALVHDYLVQYGGGERVLEAISQMYPEAPIYTLLYDPDSMYGAFQQSDIRTSFIQKIPGAKNRHRFFPWLMPIGIEEFDLSEYDLVISTSNSYAKGVITGPNTLHISYCHTPMRYAWDDCHRYFHEFRYTRAIKSLLPIAMNYIRMWDKVSASRVDAFIANSHNVAKRIQKYYHMDSTVIYPPVAVERFKRRVEVDTEEFFLMVGRFLNYKHYDIVIKAFARNGRTLKIVGAGPDEDYLRELAQGKENIEFYGRLDDEQTRALFASCQAFIFPSEDDFGIVPVEAMAAGRPVIAYQEGGALETVIEGVTGTFFSSQTVEAVEHSLRRFDSMKFDSHQIRNHAEKFSLARFQTEMYEFIYSRYNKFNTN